MSAEVTLRGCIRVWVDVQRVVRTGLHAALTSDAAGAVEIDDAIGTPVQRTRGADLNARSGVAMIATHNAEVPACVRELPFLDVFHPGAKHANGNVIFLFACHRTGMAADTSILVEHEAIAHEGLGSFFCDSRTSSMKTSAKLICNHFALIVSLSAASVLQTNTQSQNRFIADLRAELLQGRLAVS
jgi:hypothetical protein